MDIKVEDMIKDVIKDILVISIIEAHRDAGMSDSMIEARISKEFEHTEYEVKEYMSMQIEDKEYYMKEVLQQKYGITQN